MLQIHPYRQQINLNYVTETVDSVNQLHSQHSYQLILVVVTFRYGTERGYPVILATVLCH